MRKNKILLPVSIIAIIVAISMTTIFTFAFFNTSSIDSNSVKTGDVNISIIENEYDGVLDDNGNTDEKTFSVKSLGSKSTYSRVKITPSLEYYNDITNTWDVCGFINTDNMVVLCYDCHHKVHFSDDPELSPYRWESATTIESIA